MSLSSIKSKIRNILAMNIWATIIVNYRLIGLHAVFCQTVVVYGRLKKELSGRIDIADELRSKRGVVVIGSKHETYIAEAGKAQLTIKGTWKVDGNIKIGVDSCIYVDKNAELITGDGVYIARDSQIHCMKKITIGDNVLMGEIYITDSSSHEIERNGVVSSMTSNIDIGHHSYAGFRSMVLKGCRIPPYSIIGSGAVCTKDYAADYRDGHVFLVGIPAVVKEIGVTPNVEIK